MKKFGTIGVVFWVTQVNLLGIPEFELPVGTPGRQEQIDPLGQIQALTSYQNGKFCEDVHIQNTNCHLFFPIDGSQPSTADAGIWSGAQYVGQLNDNEVTDWWVRVFGGNKAVNFSNVGQARQPKEPKMGFANGFPEVIIKLGSAGLRQHFWQTFRTIAADPVGRVLLYRLFIEIRRSDNITHEGCCEAGINVANLYDRNDCRKVRIIDNQNNGFAFNQGGLIRVDFDPNSGTSVLSLNNVGTITTEEEVRPYDMGLFHEMLHWFHFLRNPDRFNDGDNDDPNAFKYSLRCYYGDQNELGMWGGSMDSEEIANILGTPRHNDLRYQHFIDQNAFLVVPNNDRSLNGDDLSENVYRISRNCHMRFGHSDYQINPVQFPPNMPHRFVLANTLAIDCYREIRGIQNNIAINWRLVLGEAIKP